MFGYEAKEYFQKTEESQEVTNVELQQKKGAQIVVVTVPYLRNNNYDEGIRNGFSAILSEITREYDINITLQEE